MVVDEDDKFEEQEDAPSNFKQGKKAGESHKFCDLNTI